MSDPKKENSPAPGTDPEKLTPEELEIINKARAEMEQAGKDIISNLDKEVQEAGGGADILKSLADATIAGQKMLENVAQQVSPYLKDLSESARKAIVEFSNYVAAADNFVTAFCESNEMERLKAMFPDAAEWIEATKEERPGGVLYLSTTLRIISENFSAIEEYVQEIGYKGTMADFMKDEKDPDTGEMLDSLFDKCFLNERPLEVIKYSFPEAVVSPINKIANNIERLENQGEAKLKIANIGKKNEVTIPVEVISPTDQEGIKIYGNYEEFDRSVQDAICTSCAGGESFFTATMLARIIAANPTLKPSKKTIDDIEKSITKQRSIIVKCDLENEAKYTKHNITDRKLSDNMISAFEGEAKINGQPVKGYWLKNKPIMLMYSEMNNQLLSLPIKLKEIREIGSGGQPGRRLEATKPRVSIRDYLLREINVIKKDMETAADAYRKYNNRRKKEKGLPEKTIDDFRKYHKDNVILYDTIFKACGLTGQANQSRINNIIYIKKCLSYWQEEKYIKGYVELPGKRKDAARGVQLKI